MLFFILFNDQYIKLGYKFKYISCYSLSKANRRKQVVLPDIQIHLMLFFILLTFVQPLHVKNSNTSHVILYPMRRFPDWTGSAYSNTSHVILYLDSTHYEGKELAEFKYISCYSLSLLCFCQFLCCWRFKYISCYSLSQSPDCSSFPSWIQIHLMLFFIRHQAINSIICFWFKYISCYSLSTTPLIQNCQWYNSNTSHVILYQWRQPRIWSDTQIQIHLMLFFIVPIWWSDPIR